MNAAVEPKVKTEVTVVKMSDGQEVGFAGARKVVKSAVIDGANVSLRMDFRNGETRSYTLPASLLLKFAGHGAEQKYGDNIGGLESVDDMILASDELNEQIQKGEWRAPRAAGANPLAGASVLLQALIEATGKPVDAIKQFLASKSLADKLALRNSDKLKPIVQRIESEKAAKSTDSKKVDTGALLGEIGL